MQQDHPQREATLAMTHSNADAPAHALEAASGLTSVQLFKRTLDTFLAKDIKGWAALCDEDVLVEFPFAPDLASRKLVGRAAIYE